MSEIKIKYICEIEQMLIVFNNDLPCFDFDILLEHCLLLNDNDECCTDEYISSQVVVISLLLENFDELTQS